MYVLALPDPPTITMAVPTVGFCVGTYMADDDDVDMSLLLTETLLKKSRD